MRKKAAGKSKQGGESPAKGGAGLSLWEVFIQPGDGAPHEHAGSVRAADPEMALQHGRDVYCRRGKIHSIWVVPAEAITASRADDSGPFFDPADDKVYRHPQFYRVPRGTKDLS